jgi:hypothetical protein
MAGHSVGNVPGSASVCFETAAVLMKGQKYNFFLLFCMAFKLGLSH